MEGIRVLEYRSSTVPLDKLIEKDAVISARYNLINGCAVMVGMIFDQNLPYEQIIMAIEHYIRQAHSMQIS